MTFLNVWIGYAICGVTLFSAVFVWAVREGQFFDIDRARFIALTAADNIDDQNKESKAGRADIYLVYAIVGITIALLAALLWVGLTGS